MFSPLELLVADTMEKYRPRKKLTGSQWADEYACLSPESSADVGKWTCFPYQREPLDVMTDLRTEMVVFMKSARVGYTKLCNHTMGYFIHQDPCNMVMYQPTEQDAEDYSKDDISPMIRDTPVLTPLVAEEKSRSVANTLRKKMFPGGQLVLAGANAPGGFRRITMRIAFFDEVDGYPLTAGKEGDQICLGIRRTDSYWNRKIIIGSTPTIQGQSKIEYHFQQTDQRRYYVPCPYCGNMQYLRWPQIKWDAGHPETAKYECEECKEQIDHSMKPWMIERGEWRPTAEAKDPRYRGYHIWAAYSYHPNSTWAHLAREFESGHKSPEQLKTFVNTVLGEVWQEKGEAPEWEDLYERRDDYRRNIVPEGGVVLTAWADVQKDRIEVEIVAWGKNIESWSIDYRIFAGDTTSLDSKCWRELRAMLSEQWKCAGGGRLMLEKLGIDSGYVTQTVYSWVRRQDQARVIVTKGVEKAPAIINMPKAVEVRESGKRISRGVRVWTIGTDIAKSEIYGHLRQKRDPEAPLPYGWCHFPEDYDSEYFKQLTAEQTVARIKNGYRRNYWEKTYERNEALDCRVGNRAMAQLIGVDRWRDDEWERRKELYLSRDAGEKPTKVKQRRESSFWG